MNKIIEIIRKLFNLNKIDELNEEVSTLKLQILNTINPNEIYYNDKYPKQNLSYKRSETDGKYNVDLRDFYTINDYLIPIVTGKDDDEKTFNSLKWVMDNITYTPDNSDLTYKENEYWAYSYQTLFHKRGDCEDGAILLANIMIRSGVPYWKIRITAGDVSYGTNVNYIKTEAIDDIWFSKNVINFGTIKEVEQHKLNLGKEYLQQQNLKKAISQVTKEPEKVDNLYANMLGKQLKIDSKFVSYVEKEIKKYLESTTKTKIEKITLEKISKYYVLLVMQDIMEKREILVNSQEKNTSGTAGHAYVTYFCESNTRWVVLDWCYWPNSLLIKDRKDYKDEENYYNVWFSWNLKYCYTQGLNTKAKEMLN